MTSLALPEVSPEQWFAVADLGDGLTHLTEPHVHHYLRCNIWHLRGRDLDVVIDTGLGLVSLLASQAHLFRGRRTLAVATHYHFDHVGGLHEFDERAIHEVEAGHLTDASALAGHLHTRGMAPEELDRLAQAGYRLPSDADLLTAAPGPDVGPTAYRVTPAAPTRLLREGDELDLGDRVLVVMHLPGHSPGSIGLWDPDRSMLFSGDAVYDGPLLDWADDASIDDYLATMRRLRSLGAEVIHGGHEASFDGRRLRELCDRYLRDRGDPSSPVDAAPDADDPPGRGPGGSWQRRHQ